LDLLRRQQALGVDSLQMQREWLQLEWVKTLRVLASIYKPNRLRNGSWISPRAADSAAARDPSYSTSRLPGKRLVSRASHDTFFKKTLQFERKYSTQGSGGSVPRVLRFFLSGFFGIFLPRFQMDPQPEPAAQGSGAIPCGVRFCKSHLHISSGFKTRQAFFEDIRKQFSRTLGTTREDFKIAQTSAGVHSSLGMLQLLLRTLTCSSRGRLRTTC
jgi:hypothetical protein